MTFQKINILSIFLICLYLSATHVFAAPYKIGSGDVIAVEVFAGNDTKPEADISGSYLVATDGSITRSWLPRIAVSDLTIEQATATYLKVIKKYIRTPKVTLKIKEYGSRQVSLIGAIVKPGTYNLSDSNKLLAALVKAGGLTNESRGEAVIVRSENGDGKGERIVVNLAKLLRGSDAAEDKALKVGDIVYFPTSESQAEGDQVIFVTGAVKKIGAFPYKPGYSALKAIIDAGGFTKFAAANRSKIHRKQDGKITIISIKLGDVVNRGQKRKDVSLKPGDIVNVPESIL